MKYFSNQPDEQEIQDLGKQPPIDTTVEKDRISEADHRPGGQKTEEQDV